MTTASTDRKARLATFVTEMKEVTSEKDDWTTILVKAGRHDMAAIDFLAARAERVLKETDKDKSFKLAKQGAVKLHNACVPDDVFEALINLWMDHADVQCDAEMLKRITVALERTWSAISADVMTVEGYTGTVEEVVELTVDADRPKMYGNDEEAIDALYSFPYSFQDHIAHMALNGYAA